MSRWRRGAGARDTLLGNAAPGHALLYRRWRSPQQPRRRRWLSPRRLWLRPLLRGVGSGVSRRVRRNEAVGRRGAGRCRSSEVVAERPGPQGSRSSRLSLATTGGARGIASRRGALGRPRRRPVAVELREVVVVGRRGQSPPSANRRSSSSLEAIEGAVVLGVPEHRLDPRCVCDIRDRS